MFYQNNFKQVYQLLFLIFGLLIVYWSAYRDDYNEKLGLNSYFVKVSNARLYNSV